MATDGGGMFGTRVVSFMDMFIFAKPGIQVNIKDQPQKINNNGASWFTVIGDLIGTKTE